MRRDISCRTFENMVFCGEETGIAADVCSAGDFRTNTTGG